MIGAALVASVPALGLIAVGAFDGARPSLPESQRGFNAIVQASQADASRDMVARSEVRGKRDARICASLPGRAVEDWVGEVTEIKRDEDGISLATRVGQDIELTTWNVGNSQDAIENTVIPPGSSLAHSIRQLEPGQLVHLSGEFPSGKQSCVQEISITPLGGMLTPSFLFRFTEVKPAD